MRLVSSVFLLPIALVACSRTGPVDELYTDADVIDIEEDLYDPDVADRETLVAVPSALSFGNLDLDEVSCIPFTLTNQGNVPIDITELALVADEPFSWSLAPAVAPVTLDVEASVEASVCVLIPSEGVFVGEVQVLQGETLLLTIPLHAESHAPDVPCLTIAPGLVDMGTVVVDTLAQETVMLRSCSRSAQTTILDFFYEGDAGILADSFPTPFILEVGDEVPYSVTFAPTEPASYRGTITFRTENQSVFLEISGEAAYADP